MIIKNHAYKRAKERLGLNKKAFDRHVGTIKSKGIMMKDLKSNLKKWVVSVIMRKKYKAVVYLYGNAMLITLGGNIITVYSIPRNLLPISKFTIKK